MVSDLTYIDRIICILCLFFIESVSEACHLESHSADTEERVVKEPPVVTEQPPSEEVSSEEEEAPEQNNSSERSRSQSIQLIKSKSGSKPGGLHSPLGSAHSFELQVCFRKYLGI